MDKKFKTLTLSFENCESLEIPAKAVKHVDLENITQDIHSYHDSITASYVAKSSLLQLDIEALEELYPSFSEYQDEYDNNGLDRLLDYSDVVSLIFITEDDHKTEVYVDWEDGYDGQSNKYQHTSLFTHPDYILDGLYIAIGKDAKFPDYVEEDDDND